MKLTYTPEELAEARAEVLPNGRHGGKSLGWVALNDSGYLESILKVASPGFDAAIRRAVRIVRHGQYLDDVKRVTGKDGAK